MSRTKNMEDEKTNCEKLAFSSVASDKYGEMILNTVAAIGVRCRCFASNVNREQLCAQLDQLYMEAEGTRLKAKNARLRLMRLSEAAEKLRRHAAINVQTGKENDARELLIQKKKIMQAMEKSKNRIELLDELCTKLDEAISLKETQLVGKIALVIEEGAQSPVRIISPKQELAEDTIVDRDLGSNAKKLEDNHNLHLSADIVPNVTDYRELKDLQGSLSLGTQNEGNLIGSLQGISCYEGFLKHLDLQLQKIEAELVSILSASSIVLGNEETKRNLKVQQTTELLESIRGIRQRVANIMHVVVDI